MIKEDLDNLMQSILESVVLVNNMISKGIRGLKERNKSLLQEVMEKDEPKENEFEIIIDEACVEMIAAYQPRAKDLRTILMILKMNNDLERMGDEAVNICQSALFLIKKPEVRELFNIPRMAEVAAKMLEDSVNSLIKKDIQLARSVCKKDSIVDELRDHICHELVTLMISNPSLIEVSTHLIRISRSLERIADLTTNICEDVIYMEEGKIIKHRFNK